MLENSTIINGWSVTSFGSILTIKNSDISRLGSYNISWPPDYSHSPTDITSVSNCSIDELMLYYSSATLIFDNTSIHFLNAYLPSDTIIKGNITFNDDAIVRNWVNSIITRNYPVDLRDQNGNIISGSDLYLYSKSGDLVWLGATDENGKADFDIVFDDSNYSDAWQLEIDYGGRKLYKDITLLTATPIVIPRYTFIISSGAGGTTYPAPGTYTYDEGTEVTITAIPDINYRFSKWTGDVASEGESDNPITITIDSDKSITANFKQKPFWDRCFIATAAYGSPLHSSVRALKDFRDRYLMRSKVGRALILFYYRHSPPVADFIARQRSLRIAVQVVLFPLVAFSYLMLRFGPVITTVMFSLIFAFLVFLVRFHRKRARRAQIRIRKQMRTGANSKNSSCSSA